MSWSHIVGHDRHIDAFRHVVASRRLAHAYLFVGLDGVGKRLFARELAKALLCENGDNFNACDQCAACRLVDADTHPDLIAVRRPDEANELPVELVRELCRGFSLKSARGHGKVALLEDADGLNEDGANSFLKTLEEPPPSSIFLLVSSSSDRQLATIQSRCQIVRFAPLKADQVRTILQKHDVSDQGQLERLVRLASGSPGQALALADDSLWQFRRRLLEGLAQPRVDSLELAHEFLAFAEEAGKESAGQRRRSLLAIRLLVEALGDALRLSVGATPYSSDPADATLLRALAQRASPEKLLELQERCLETEGHIGRYVQLALVLEGLLDALGRMLEAPGAVAV